MFRYSIRGRAALLTSVSVAAALAAFTWFAVARMQADLIRRGFERAESAASTIAAQSSQSTQLSAARLTQLAGGAAVQNFLRAPNDRDKAAIIDAVRALGQTTQEATVEIWNGDGRLLLDDMAVSVGPRTIPVLGAAPTAHGVTPLLTHGDVLFARSIVEIPDGADTAHRVGYLVVSRAVRAAGTSTLVNRIVGNEAVTLIGNQTGDVWTDLSGIAPAPKIDLNAPGGREFRDGSGTAMIGAPANIAGTPWVLLIAFPRSVILGPAWQLLGVLVAASLVITAAATLAARERIER